MPNPFLWLLNTVASWLDGRVIRNEYNDPYLFRGYIWGWRPPKPCPGCQGKGWDFDGSLTLVSMHTHPDHPRARACGECNGTGKEPERKSRFNAYLHCFLRGDSDDALHSHPWPWSISLVLWGGYTEERLVFDDHGRPWVKTRRVWPGTLNIFRGGDLEATQHGVPDGDLTPEQLGDYHRVTKLHGKQTWTLFLTGPKDRTWFFYVLGRGRVPWRDRLRERGINVQEEV